MRVERGTPMRRTKAAARTPGAAQQDSREEGEVTVVTGELRQPDEMSARVLGIIGAYRMGGDVEARDLCPKSVPEAVPQTCPRPAEGYIRNGVYHVADTAPVGTS
jgi:hypothetical protein